MPIKKYNKVKLSSFQEILQGVKIGSPKEWKSKHSEHMDYYKMIVPPDDVFNSSDNILVCNCGSKIKLMEGKAILCQ